MDSQIACVLLMLSSILRGASAIVECSEADAAMNRKFEEESGTNFFTKVAKHKTSIEHKLCILGFHIISGMPEFAIYTVANHMDFIFQNIKSETAINHRNTYEFLSSIVKWNLKEYRLAAKKIAELPTLSLKIHGYNLLVENLDAKFIEWNPTSHYYRLDTFSNYETTLNITDEGIILWKMQVPTKCELTPGIILLSFFFLCTFFLTVVRNYKE